MLPYKTNSADYLDYIASSMSREEILADPKFCGLLENEYIKDNMEVALKWREAKFGDYKAKYEFVEYYLCNGPELDADTLLHYRGMAQADPVIMEIAYGYFTDPQVLSEIREKKYGKKKNNDWTDCFTNPCFYLGDFSPAMGSMGDDVNYKAYWKNISEKWAWKLKETSEENAANQATAIGGDLPPPKPTTTIEGAVKPTQDAPANGIGTGPASGQNISKIRPSYCKGWARLGKAFADRNEEAWNESLNILRDKHTGWCRNIKMDDWFAGALQQTLDLVDKANTVRQLGDCYRMWSQVRRLQVYGPDNQYGPITSDQLVDTKMPDGTPRKVMNNTHPAPADSTAGISESHAANAQKALQGAPVTT